MRKSAKIVFYKKLLLVAIAFFFAENVCAQSSTPSENITNQNKDPSSLNQDSIWYYKAKRYYAKVDSCQRVVDKLNDWHRSSGYWYYVSMVGIQLSPRGGLICILGTLETYDELSVEVVKVDKPRLFNGGKIFYSEDLWDK